ncbi:ferritin [Peptoniphilus sp.]|jgi:ferritin|uniref:ferritin n=1 Tax=Peptoniphilus sp. TaxID=1971214 RepID=UPI003D91B411
MSKLNDAINKQYNFEIESAYLYVSMAHYMEEKGMSGFAHFFLKQAHEEIEHAEKMSHYLFSIDEKPTLEAIKKPQEEFGNFTETFKAAYEHEQEVTKRINELYDFSIEENDHKATSMLQWFVDEQVEEEDSFRTLIEQLERVNESWAGLYLLDEKLGQR